MKVGVWIDKHEDAQVGGRFSYNTKLINLIDKYEFDQSLEIVFISYNTIKSNFSKKKIKLIKGRIKKSFFEKVAIIITKKIVGLKYIAKRIISKYKIRSINDIRNQLRDNNIDVLYYISPMVQRVVDYPFITTNWDIGHISMYCFPEVGNDRNLHTRNAWYNTSFKKALAIFVESNSGKEELVNYLSINPDRIKVLPIFPGDVINVNIGEDAQNHILKKYALQKQKYFFYPAQFWAHKNHYNLISAFKLLLRDNKNIKIIFTGSDKGNLNYILSYIVKENLLKNVFYLGFVNNEELYTFYKNTIAMVMPTFLGPTNMPLLEARELQCPVLCSDLKGHREQLGNGAIYFNPLNPLDISDAMFKIMDIKIRRNVLIQAKKESLVSKFNYHSAIKNLEINLLEVKNYRNCWR